MDNLKPKTGKQKRIFTPRLAFGIFVLVFLAVTPFAFAENRYNLLAPLPTTGDNPTFNEYMPGLVRFLVLFAIVAAVVMIAIGGIMYAVSEAIESQKSARSMITDALWGLAIVLLSYLILNTINPDLVNLKITIPSLKNLSTGTNTNTNTNTGNNTNTTAKVPAGCGGLTKPCCLAGAPQCDVGGKCSAGLCVPASSSSPGGCGGGPACPAGLVCSNGACIMGGVQRCCSQTGACGPPLSPANCASTCIAPRTCQ